MIKNIKNSIEFKNLINLTTSNPFDLFEVMRIQSKEMVHSNVLANFLNRNKPHGLGDAFVNEFINSIKNIDRVGSKSLQIEEIVLNATCSSTENYKVSLELEYMDILLEFPNTKLAIAIENKIWAGEQKNQISRYQQTLQRRYPGYSHGLVFLTPDGREPETIDRNSLVPVYCMSYGMIVDLLKKLPQDSISATVSFFITQFINHLEGYMTGNSETKELCWKLFSQHEEAYKQIVREYDYCVGKKIENSLIKLRGLLKSDSMFSSFTFDDSKIISTGKDKGRVNWDMDLRLTSWPNGVLIKVYKHGWFGVFPFATKSVLDTIKISHPELHKIAKQIPDSGWRDLYYLSSCVVNSNDRCIREDGDEITDDDINAALSKVKVYIDEINNKLT